MSVKSSLINFAAILLLIPGPLAAADSCPQGERYLKAFNRCFDQKSEYTIALGVLRHETRRASDTEETVVLEDDEKGEMELLLTPPLKQLIATSPAESYEVEGLLSTGSPYPLLLVQSLRPIE